MGWRRPLLAFKFLLVGAVTGWRCPDLPARYRTTLLILGGGGGKHIDRFPSSCPFEQRRLIKSSSVVGLRSRRREQSAVMTTAAGDDSGASDRPSKDFNKAAWQRRARRAMNYVSMPIVSIPGQPREQLMLALPYPAADTTIKFVLDTMRRKTLITPEARVALGVVDGPGVGDQPDFGACIELPAARIGRENGDHFLVVMDAVVANVEQAKVLGPNTGGVLGLDFLNRYDIDLNFETNEARLYVAGAVDQGLIDTSELEGLACGYLPGGKLGIKMELNGAGLSSSRICGRPLCRRVVMVPLQRVLTALQHRFTQFTLLAALRAGLSEVQGFQPALPTLGGAFTGVLDLASNSTAGNWLAARDLDVTSMAQGQPSSYPRETGRSRPLMCAPFDTIQLGHVLLTSVVAAKTAREGRLAVYVGHLLEFESIARDISSKPRGRQLALVGQDLIAHTRVVLSCRSNRLYFAPLEANDVWAGQVV